MREILFRGKTKDKDGWDVEKNVPIVIPGEWLYGYYVKGYNNYDQFIVPDDFINHLSRGGHRDTDILYDYCVVSGTVGQYTGLCDSKGNKVFEGDIVKNTVSSEIGVVEQIKGCWRVECGYRDFSLFDYPVKIIGNIHDNKELI